MKADLYICSETFSHNGIDSIIDVTRKLSSFQMMLEKIAEHQDDNTLYVDQKDFVSIAIFNDGKSINDILSEYQTSIAVYGKDVLTLLFSIFKRCNNASVCLDDMKAYLDIEDESNCNAIIVLNPLKGYEEHVQVLSNIGSWFIFRREYLAKYPVDQHFFLTETKKYFPNLCIHEKTKTTLKDVLYSHPRRIVTYLSILNDFLIPEFTSNVGLDFVAFLSWFASKHNLDGASFEGKKDDKFIFTFPDGTKAYCEPHLKMHKDDAGNQNQHCRIYFKSPKNSDKMVYIGCICQHL